MTLQEGNYNFEDIIYSGYLKYSKERDLNSGFKMRKHAPY